MDKQSQPKASPRTEFLKNCPVCESENTQLFFSARDRLCGVPGEFSYHRCGACASVFQNPMVAQEDLYLCYPPEYMPYDYNPEIPEINFESNNDDEFLKNPRDVIRRAVVKEVWGEPLSGFNGIVGKILAKSRFIRKRAFYGSVEDACLPRDREKNFALDVGCGAGWMMKRLKAVGWRVEGVEWNEKAAEAAEKRTGQKVWAGDFRQIELPKGKYQMIFLSHVFEHLNEPLAALERFYELLAKNGKLVLIFPNAASTDAAFFGELWYAWDPPRHLILPSAEAIKRLGAKAGFANSYSYTNVTGYVWTGSKAYKLGQHPEKVQPKLDFRENLELFRQRVLTNLGADKGSETVMVLEKL